MYNSTPSKLQLSSQYHTLWAAKCDDNTINLLLKSVKLSATAPLLPPTPITPQATDAVATFPTWDISLFLANTTTKTPDIWRIPILLQPSSRLPSGGVNAANNSFAHHWPLELPFSYKRSAWSHPLQLLAQLKCHLNKHLHRTNPTNVQCPHGHPRKIKHPEPLKAIPNIRAELKLYSIIDFFQRYCPETCLLSGNYI